MHFGENELSPSSIGFSPLNLPHLPTFQRRWVRASTVSYHSFTLDRLRSPGFASTPSDYVALFRLGFPSAPLYLTSPLNVTRRIILQKARHHSEELWPLVSTQFQVLFHSPPGVLFTFPSRYYTLSVSKSIYPYGIWSSQIHTEFLVFHVTWERTYILMSLPVQDYHLLRSSFPTSSSSVIRYVEYLTVLQTFFPQPHISNGCILDTYMV